MTKEKIIQLLNRNLENYRRFGVKSIGLFGSYQKNEQHTSSDIDILVSFEEGKKTFDNYMELKFYLEELLQGTVDLVITDALKPDLKQSILNHVQYASGR